MPSSCTSSIARHRSASRVQIGIGMTQGRTFRFGWDCPPGNPSAHTQPAVEARARGSRVWETSTLVPPSEASAFQWSRLPYATGANCNRGVREAPAVPMELAAKGGAAKRLVGAVVSSGPSDFLRCVVDGPLQLRGPMTAGVAIRLASSQSVG
jgi:hypothetical protein